MVLNILIVFVAGLLAGWLIEWVIDWIHWRRPRKQSSNPNYKSQIRPSTLKPLSRDGLHSRVDNLVTTNPALGDILVSLISQPDMVNKSPDGMAMKMQSDLAGWFDDVMDRSSGDYKRRASKWAMLFGTILAFAFNVDSIEIATRMWREPTLRQVIVAQAQNYQGDGEDIALDNFVSEVNQLGIPIGWSTIQPTDGQECGWIPGQAVYPAIYSNNSCQILLNLPRMDDGWGWLMKFSGLLISGLAAAQGAPFWFDILKKVVNLRSSGAVPKSTRSETAGSE